MGKPITSASILRKIDCDKLALYKGDGYWYFIYDDAFVGIYESESVYTMYLNNMNVDRWVEIGAAFVARVEMEHADRVVTKYSEWRKV